jgi:hypothetical protein
MISARNMSLFVVPSLSLNQVHSLIQYIFGQFLKAIGVGRYRSDLYPH